MSDKPKYFEECCSEDHLLKRRYVDKKQPGLTLGLEDAKRLGLPQNIIEKAEEKGMLNGELEVTPEGASRAYTRIRESLTEDQQRAFDYFHPTRDAALIANWLFSINPAIRNAACDRVENLYKIALNAGRRRGERYPRPIAIDRSQDITDGSDEIISTEVRSWISSIPEEQYVGDEEYQRRAKVLLRKAAERDTFPLFKDDEQLAFETLQRKTGSEKNSVLRDVYQRLMETYRGYSKFSVIGANPDFEDPETGQTGVLPSLHQKIALYHLMKEKKFGVFDGCGTGKTAIATLAQSLIEEELKKRGKEFRRTVVVCPNNSKKAWRRGLIGTNKERYLGDPQDVTIINGEEKDESFLDELKSKKWIVVNYEQLTTKVNGTGRLFVDELVEMGVDYVVFDEAHHIKTKKDQTKTGGSTQSAAARRLGHKAEYLCLLTGTPMPDRPDDFAVLNNLGSIEILQ